MTLIHLFLLLAAMAMPAAGRQQNVPTFSDDACLVRGNDDDVPDLALWAGGWDRARIVVIDGKTGGGLWASDPIPHLADTYLFCSNPETVIVGVSDFTVRAFEAASGRERWRATVSDQPHKAAVGSDCLLVLTQDDKKTGLSLATGAARSCSVREPPRNYRDRTAAPLEMAGATISLETRAKGTPMLTAVASRGKKSLWETPLAIAKALGAPRPAVIGADLYVSGVEIADHAAALIDVDTASGRVRWKRKFDCGINLVRASGPRLYVGICSTLIMLDPATGQDVWEAAAPPSPR
jgi:outer membrane protein assembly factor BamB